MYDWFKSDWSWGIKDERMNIVMLWNWEMESKKWKVNNDEIKSRWGINRIRKGDGPRFLCFMTE